MDEPNISQSVYESLISTSELKDLSLDYADLAFDSFTNNEILKEIPVVKHIYAIYKSTITIRDHLLIKKIIVFLKEYSNVDEEKKKKFLDGVNSDVNYQRKIGEQLIIILDKFDVMEKSQILAKVFIGYVEGLISYEEFVKISQSIDRAFLSDLHTIKQNYDKGVVDINAWQNLYSVGLANLYFKEAHRNEKIIASDSAKYGRNDLGCKFIYIFFGDTTYSDNISLLLPSYKLSDCVLFKKICDTYIESYPEIIHLNKIFDMTSISISELRRLCKKLDRDGYIEMKEAMDFRGTKLKLTKQSIKSFARLNGDISTVMNNVIQQLRNGERLSHHIAANINAPKYLVDYILNELEKQNFIRLQDQALVGGVIISELISLDEVIIE